MLADKAKGEAKVQMQLDRKPWVKRKEYLKELRKRPKMEDGTDRGEAIRKARMAEVQVTQSASGITPANIITNPLLPMLKNLARENKMGVGSDEQYKLFENAIKKVSYDIYTQVKLIEEGKLRRDAYVLEKYRLPFEKKSLTEVIKNTPVDSIPIEQKLYYYWANPWIFFHDVVGFEVLTKTSQAVRSFDGFYQFQQEFLRDLLDPLVHGVIIKCCRGGGKTWLCALGAVMQSVLIPNVKITINSGAEGQAKYMYQYYSTIINNTAAIKHMLLSEPTSSKTDFKHGGRTMITTASEKSSRGLRPDIIYFDETCQITPPLINAALGGTWTSVLLKVVMSSTPNYMNHPFHKVWVEAEELGFKKFHWSCYDVPWISPEAIQKAKLMYDDNTFRIEMMGEFGALIGSVFDHGLLYEASDEKRIDKMLTDREIVVTSVGVDWGFANPTAITVIGVDKEGKLWLLSSFAHSSSRSDMTSLQLAQIVVETVKKYRAEQIFSDNSFKFENRDLNNAIAEAFEGSDQFVGVTAIKFAQFKNSMISQVKQRLEKKELILDSRVSDNKKLLDQMFAYEYDTDEAGMSREKPKKGHDDYVDSLMLAVWAFRQSAYIGEVIGIRTDGYGDGLVRESDEVVDISSGGYRKSHYYL